MPKVKIQGIYLNFQRTFDLNNSRGNSPQPLIANALRESMPFNAQNALRIAKLASEKLKIPETAGNKLKFLINFS